MRGEIALRMALGAARSGILQMVIKQGLLLTLLGIGVGLAGVFALIVYLESFLYGISPTDPFTLATVAAILLGVALLACLIPARRAAKVDPMKALRYE